MSVQNQAMKSKELSVDLRDRIVSRHRSGEGYRKISEALKAPMSTVASIIRKEKKFGTTRTLRRVGLPGQTERSGEKGISQGGDQQPDSHSHRALVLLCEEKRTFQKDNHLCSTLPNTPVW